jgi:hypothetical protein
MKLRVVVLAAWALGLFLVAPSSVEARKVEDIFRGKIFLLSKRPPARFANQSAWVGYLRRNNLQHVWPDKNNKKEWRFEFMAFFTKALNDIEVTVKFYDITEAKRFVAADSWDMPDKGQRILASNMMVNQPRFAVNRKYQMQILNAKSELLATTIFWLRGQKEVYSGRVNFTDEDARKKGDDD